MKTSAFDDALTVQKKAPFYVDAKMLAIVGVAIVAIVAFWMVML